MTPAEEAFVREIRGTIHTSADFREAVREGLTPLLGESPAETLIMSIGDAGFKSPAQFVRFVSAIFGESEDLSPIYSAILETAQDPEWLAGRSAYTVHYRARRGGLGPNQMGKLSYEEERSAYLHDHRDSDDFSEEDPR